MFSFTSWQDCHELVASALAQDGARSLEDALPGHLSEFPSSYLKLLTLAFCSFNVLLDKLAIEPLNRDGYSRFGVHADYGFYSDFEKAGAVLTQPQELEFKTVIKVEVKQKGAGQLLSLKHAMLVDKARVFSRECVH